MDDSKKDRMVPPCDSKPPKNKLSSETDAREEELLAQAEKLSSSTSSDHTDRDGVNWGSTRNRQEVRNVKDYHDSVVHDVVLDNNPNKLRDILNKGLVAFGKSIDGATPLHRAAEIGSISCADVLLDFKADINAVNLVGETPFHVAALNQHIEFGRHLLDKKAVNNCGLVGGRKGGQ